MPEPPPSPSAILRSNTKYRRAGKPSVAIVGGGLAGCLVAKALVTQRSDLNVTVFESGSTLGGKHTWCWHRSDVEACPGGKLLMEGLEERQWSSYHVHFPTYSKAISLGYAGMRSKALANHMTAILGDRLHLKTPVQAVQSDGVSLENGTFCPADLVLDARGGPPTNVHQDNSRTSQPITTKPVAFQKFYGHWGEVDGGHGVKVPVVMDARINQTGGFSFIYVLPWSPTKLLIEFTCYSLQPNLSTTGSVAVIKEWFNTHCRSNGTVETNCKDREFKVVEEESGCLPVPLFGAAPKGERPGVALVGTKAGYFHPATAYSVPAAVAFATWLTKQDFRNTENLLQLMESRRLSYWQSANFYRRLNRMLMLALPPADRWPVMARFYTMPRAAIARFYRSESGVFDIFRLLCKGSTTVSWSAAWRAFCSEDGYSKRLRWQN